MDRITKSLLTEFATECSISALPEDVQFEHFSCYLNVGRHLSESFDTADVVTGSGGDTGIDGIAVVINGTLATDPELVTELESINGFLDVSFIFVQSERSSGFDTSKIGQFGFGVRDFFSENPKLPRNSSIAAAAEIMTAVYARSSKFKRGNPVLDYPARSAGGVPGP